MAIFYKNQTLLFNIKITPYSTEEENGWEKAVAGIMDTLKEIKTKRYAELRDFDDNVIQASDGYVY